MTNGGLLYRIYQYIGYQSANNQWGSSQENKIQNYILGFRNRPKMVAQHNTGDTYKLLVSVYNTATQFRINANFNDGTSNSDWIAIGIS